MEDFNPEKPRKCTWYVGADMSLCPHMRKDWTRPPYKVLSSALDAIGHTPLIKLNKIPQSLGVTCDILAKCEFFNPGGSVKDRVGYQAIEIAEKTGLLKPGYTVLVPTSGNTGIGMALVATLKGYRCVIVMSEKMSKEKQFVIESLGAEVIRTPVSADSFSPNGIFGVSYKLKSEIPSSWVANQYIDSSNPMAHFDGTALELLEQCDNKIDGYVASVGTGGTLCGVAMKLKEIIPNCKVIGADPVGSKIARPDSLNVTDKTFFEVEGIGYEFNPQVLNYDVVDQFIKIDDPECHQLARRLIKEEGLLCGASSGTALAAALRLAKSFGPGQRIVMIAPDSIRNYLTKFVDDHWMEARHFKPTTNPLGHSWWDHAVTCLNLPQVKTLSSKDTIHKVFHLMKKDNVDVVPIIDKNTGGIVGIAEQKELVKKLVNKDVNDTTELFDVVTRIYPKAYDAATVGLVSRILEAQDYCVVYKQVGKNEIPLFIVKHMDLLQYTVNQNSCC